MDNQNRAKRNPVTDPPQRTSLAIVGHVVWKIIAVILAIVMTFAIIGGIAGVIVYDKAKAYINNEIIPNSSYSLEDVKLNQSSFIYALDSSTGEFTPIRQLYATENRVRATYDEFPEDMIHAAVAIEDKRFYTHKGVDWKRTLSACVNMFLGGDSYGGSTITQQLIKNLTKKDEVTVRRKLSEIFTALEFEEHYTKEEILEWYLNTVYFSEGAYGAKSAAKTYFGKELSELTTKECASIVGITNNPSKYDPYIYPENNEKRTRLILDQMREQGYLDDLSEREYQALYTQKLVFGSKQEQEQTYSCASCGFVGTLDEFTHDTENKKYLCPDCETPLVVEEEHDYYTYFEDQVIRDVISDLMDEYGYTQEYASQLVTTGGYKIYSTIDLQAQEKVDSVYQDLSQIPGTYSTQQLQSAIVLIDNESGDIIAMAGGVGEKTGSLTWNHATMSQRPTGSSIKPVTVYGPGLEYGVITPASAYEDSPYDEARQWPQNDSRSYSGWMLVYNGLVRSLNTISVKTCADVGVDKCFEFAKEKMGLTSLVDSETINGKEFTDKALAPLALGQQTHGITVREMSNAFAVFPNKGVYRKARTYTRVEDSNGKTILDNDQQVHTAMSEHAAWYVTYLLRNAVSSGTGYSAYMNNTTVCGKTGTSSDNQDRWFSGYTPNYTAAVWCGYEQPEEIRLTSGGNPSCTLWKKVMTLMHADIESKTFEAPTDEAFVSVSVCSQTGLLAGKDCKAQTVSLFASDVPDRTCDGHDTITVQLCYPEGNYGESSKKYVATDSCMKYFELVNSDAFRAIDMDTMGGISARFMPNEMEDYELAVLKAQLEDETLEEDKLLEEAMKTAELEKCPVHTPELVAQLRKAIDEMGGQITTSEPDVTEPDVTVPPDDTEPTEPPSDTAPDQHQPPDPNHAPHTIDLPGARRNDVWIGGTSVLETADGISKKTNKE